MLPTIKPGSTCRVGFIGFGEVASVFSECLVAAGVEVLAFDSKLESGMKLLRARDRTGRIKFCGMVGLVDDADVILSTVTPTSAVQVAELCGPMLHSRHVFVDLNSTGPATKCRIRQIIETSGAAFVEGVILGAVRVFGATSRVLLGGSKAGELAHLLRDFGLATEAFSEEIGGASTFKLLRSIFSKNIEAVLLETLIAAELADMQGAVWSEIVSIFTGRSFDSVAESWITTHPDAHGRRLEEIAEVLVLIRHHGLTPIMTEAASSFFERSQKLDFSGLTHLDSRAIKDVVDMMAKQVKA